MTTNLLQSTLVTKPSELRELPRPICIVITNLLFKNNPFQLTNKVVYSYIYSKIYGEDIYIL